MRLPALVGSRFRGVLAASLTVGAIVQAGCGRPADPAPVDVAAAPTRTLTAFADAAPVLNPDRKSTGRLLFFDQRLSGDRTMSCATCHDSARGFADGFRTARGKGGKALLRNTPSVINIDARAPFFWDGRAATAEEQALGPVGNPDEMGKDVGELVTDLNGVPEYVARFKRAFGDSTITGERIGKAIATFERTLVSADAPLDRYLEGDKTALSPEALQGMDLFTGKAACIKCHDGPHLTDASFHNIGVAGPDTGRYTVLSLPVMKGAFKTPSLRDIELTAPYFHDGSVATLRDVVAHYNRGGDTKDNLDPDIKPLSLSDAEQDALVAFMKALTGTSLPAFDPPRIPRVVERPSFQSTRQLMKNTDGMLHQLDTMVANVEGGQWNDVRKALATLVSDSEELAAFRFKATKPERLGELKELLGDLIIDLRELDSHAARHDRAKATMAYDRVRGSCDSCHEAFRWTKKNRNP